MFVIVLRHYYIFEVYIICVGLSKLLVLTKWALPEPQEVELSIRESAPRFVSNALA